MTAATERRQHHRVRAIFEEALTLCVPFLDPRQGIGGQALTHHIPVVLRDRFPELSPEELLVLVPALQTAWRLRQRTRAVAEP
ncbi:hypothetical protein [Tepidimonas sp.]|uniref:hypothetical protein n=1 Tax=Tepidimonas sp. TaxID=2002775 RepID=UPI002FDFB759